MEIENIAHCTLVISRSRTLLANKFYMYILLCCMIPLHAVGPILEVDLRLLENEFNNGHRDGESQDSEGRDLHWCNENNTFESPLPLDLVLVILNNIVQIVHWCLVCRTESTTTKSLKRRKFEGWTKVKSK